MVNLRNIFLAVVAVMAFSAEALADQNCNCFQGGYNAFKSTQSCSGRPAYCPKDVWEQGCYDARNQNQRYRQKWCGGGTTASGGRQPVAAKWHARRYWKSAGQCPPDMELDGSRSFCLEACEAGWYGGITNRNVICYQCADGRKRRDGDLLMSGDGRLVCR